MVSDPSSMAKDAGLAAEKPIEGSLSNKKSQVRVPKKIHKAEREKLKRDQLNELFVELGHVLEPDRQNNCKASILGDTTRVLRDLFAQVESLRMENVTLLSESRYITVERNELKDENATLQIEISELQTGLQARTHPDPAWSSTLDASPVTLPQPSAALLSMHHQPVLMEPPVHVAPIRELQLFPETRCPTPPASPRTSPNVRRPHARYPTESDSWPGQFLFTLPQAAATPGGRCSTSSSLTTSTSKEESSDREQQH